MSAKEKNEENVFFLVILKFPNTSLDKKIKIL